MLQYSFCIVRHKLIISGFLLSVLGGFTGMLYASQPPVARVDSAFGPMMVLEDTGSKPKKPKKPKKTGRPQPETAFEAEFYQTMDDPNCLGPVLKSGEPSRHDLSKLRNATQDMQCDEHPCVVPDESDREAFSRSPFDRQTTIPWNPTNNAQQSTAVVATIATAVEDMRVTEQGQGSTGESGQTPEFSGRQSGKIETPSGAVVEQERTCGQLLWAILSCQCCRT